MVADFFVIHKFELSASLLCQRLINIVLGVQGSTQGDNGLTIFWFVYSLAILKIVRQYLPGIKSQGVVLALCVAVAIYWHQNKIILDSSWANACVAYPFFFIGVVLRRWKDKINNLRVSRKVVTITLLSSVVYLVTASRNGAAWMYKNMYGNNYLWFIIAACTSCFVIFVVCKYFERFHKCFGVVYELSIGTIVVLAFQLLAINFTYYLFGEEYLKIAFGGMLKYPLALVVLLLFVPVVKFVARYCPILMGTRGR